MAKDLGTYYILVQPSTKGLGKAIEGSLDDGTSSGVQKSSRTILSRVGGAFTKVGKIGVGAVAGVATGLVGLAAKGGFDRALNIENAQAKLKGLGHDSESVSEIMNNALASVKGTAFGLGDAATVAASLSASGVKSGKQLTDVLKTVADTAQISGRELTDVGTIFGSVAARGKLQGDDMLQLMSSGIPVLQMLANHLGTTSEAVSDMVSAGEIDFQTFADAMQEGLGGAAQSAGTTFTGALANVKAALSRLGETAATPVLNGLRDLFNQLIPVIDQFAATAEPALKAFGDILGTTLAQAVPTANSLLQQLQGTLQWYEEHGAPISAALMAIAAGFLAVKGYQTLNGGLTALTRTMDAVASGAQSAGRALLLMQDLGGPAAALRTYAGSLTLVANAQKALSSGQAMFTAIKGAATGFGAALSGTIGVMGMVGIGVAAVVAAMALFFTQTETGRAAWQSFMQFLQPLWQQVQAAWQAALPVLQSLMQSIGNTISNVVSTVGPVLSSLASSIGPLLSSIASGMADRFQTIVGVVGSVLQQIGPTLGQIGGQMADAFATLAQASMPVLESLAGLLSTILQPIIAQLPALSDAFAQLGQAFAQAGADLAPVMADMMTQIGDALAQLSPVIAELVTAFAQLGPALLTPLIALASTLMSALAPVITMVAGLAAQILPVIMQLATTLVSALVPVITTIISLAAQILPVIAQILPVIAQLVSMLVGTLVPVVVQLAATLVSALVPVITLIVSAIAAFLPVVATLVTTLVSLLIPVITAIVNVITAMVPVITAVVSAIIGVVTPVITTIIGVIQSVVTVLTGVITFLTGVFTGNWSQAWDGIKQVFSGVWQAIKSILSGAWNTVQALIRGGLTVITSLWNAAWNGLSGAFSAIWNGIKTAASSGVNAVVSVITGIKDKITGAFANAGSWLVNAGSNIVNGLVDGIKGAVSKVVEAAKSVADSAINAAKNALGIHSPSRVFRDQIGLMIGAGMGQGVSMSRGLVERSLDEMTAKLQSGIEPLVVPVTALATTGGNGTTSVVQNFTTKVVRADSDLHVAASIIHRNAAREARLMLA